MEDFVDDSATEADAENDDCCYMIVVGEDCQSYSEIPATSFISDFSLRSPSSIATHDQFEPNTIKEDQNCRSSRMEVFSMVPLLTRLEDDKELCKWVLENNKADYVLTRHKAKLENERRRKRNGCKSIFNNRNNCIALGSNNKRTSESIGHSVERKRFTCTICDYSCTSKSSLDVHLLLHGNALKCSMRSYSTKTPTVSLNRIGETIKDVNRAASSSQVTTSVKHSSERPFRCLECPWTGKLLSHLNSHMLKHFKEKRSCSLPSQVKSSRERHRSSQTMKNSKIKGLDYSGEIKASSNSHQDGHMLTNVKGNESGCILSDLNTSDKENVRIHTLTGSSKNMLNMFECVLCSFKTCFEMQIQSHVRSHKKQPAVDFKPQGNLFLCEHCPYEGTSEEQLDSHLRSHSGGENGQFICDRCGCQFDQNAHLLEHSCALEYDLDELLESQAPMDIDPNLSSEWKAEEGGNEQTEEISITDNNYYPDMDHVLVETDASENPAREKSDSRGMDQIFDFDFSFVQHAASTPSDNIRKLKSLVKSLVNEKPARKKTCRSCRKQFNKDELEEHMLTHYKPFACDECPYLSKTLSKLEFHKTSRHKSSKKFACLYCKYVADLKSDLDRHVTTVHGETYRFSCEQCTYKCFSEVELKHHQASHSDPFACTLCSKRFTLKRFLMQHKCVGDRRKSASTPAGSAVSAHQDEIMDETNQEDGNTTQISEVDNSSMSAQYVLRDPGSTVVLDGMENNRNQHQQATNVSNKKVAEEFTLIQGIIDLVKNSTPAAYKDEPGPLCHICGVLFSHKSALRLHLPRHSDDHPFKCHLCTKRFKRADSLRTHMTIHTGEWVSCDFCSYQTPVMKHLAIHMKTHSDEKPYPCRKCDYRTKYKNKIRQHERNVHGQHIKFNCSFCEKKVFTTIEGYKKHLKYIHQKRIIPQWISEPKIYRPDPVALQPASIDGDEAKRKRKAFNKADELEESNNFGIQFLALLGKLGNPMVPESEKVTVADLYEDIVLSESELSFICEHCGKTYKSSATLKNHLISHTQDRPFECPKCTYSAKRRVALTQHMLTHSGSKGFSCPYCDYKALKKCYMDVHVRTHTGERPYACDKCSFQTVSISSLKVHKRIHTGERPFACPHCPRRFRQGGALRTHRCAGPLLESSVDPDPPASDELYSCVECGYIATNRLSLVRHKVRAHKKVTTLKSFSCQKCLQTFSAKYKQMRHKCKVNINQNVAMDEQTDDEESGFPEKDLEDVSDRVNTDWKEVNGKLFTDEGCNKQIDSLRKITNEVKSDFEDVNDDVNPDLIEINQKLISDRYVNKNSEFQSVMNHLNHESLVDNQSRSQENLLDSDDFNMDVVGPEVIICEFVEENCLGEQPFLAKEGLPLVDSGNGCLQSILPIHGNVNNQAADGLIDETVTGYIDQWPTQVCTENCAERTVRPFVPPVDITQRCICNTCGKVLQNKDAMVEHLETTHLKKPYKCEICSYAAARSRLLRKHMLRAHNMVIEEKTRTRKLQTCDKKATNESSINAGKPVSESLKCGLCSFSTDSRETLEIHLQEHKGSKLSSCKTCSRSFFTCYQMTHHTCSVDILGNHNNSRDSESALSEQERSKDVISQALDDSEVISEMDTKADSQNQKKILYKCNSCEGTFSNIIVLQDHIQAHTDDGFKNVLETSGVKSEIAKKANVVSIRNQEKILYKCNNCDATFSNIILLQDHIQAHKDNGVKNVTVNVIVEDE